MTITPYFADEGIGTKVLCDVTDCKGRLSANYGDAGEQADFLLTWSEANSRPWVVLSDGRHQCSEHTP